MIAMSQNAALLVMWVVYSVLAMGGLIAVFVWCVRTRQFSDQDRARYLALQSGIPQQQGPGTGDQGNGNTETETQNSELRTPNSNV